MCVPVTAARALSFAQRGDRDAARDALLALGELRPTRYVLLDPGSVEAALAAWIVGDPGLVAYALETASVETPWMRAVHAIVEGRLVAAAHECESAGNLHYEALLGLHAIEAGEVVQPAQRERFTAFRKVRASRYLGRLDALAAEAV